MAGQIHPTAIIETGAQLGTDVEVGAYGYVGGGVTLGTGTRLHHHASVEGNTHLGAQCEVFPYALLGAKTQDMKFQGGKPGLRIGDRNVFREYVSVHCATNDGEFTTIGSDNTFLAYGHIAHDCRLGSHIVASNYFGLSGHITIEDHVVIGGMAGIHQFVRIGAYAMVGGMAKLVQDVPPFMMADGNPAETRTVNKTGMERNGVSEEAQSALRQAYKILFREGLTVSNAIAKAEKELPPLPEVRHLIQFVRASERGISK